MILTITNIIFTILLTLLVFFTFLCAYIAKQAKENIIEQQAALQEAEETTNNAYKLLQEVNVQKEHAEKALYLIRQERIQLDHDAEQVEEHLKEIMRFKQERRASLDRMFNKKGNHIN